MRRIHQRMPWRRLAILGAGATFILSGCDPQLRATVESGIITLSQSLLGSIFQALLQLSAETDTTAARVVTDLGPIFA